MGNSRVYRLSLRGPLLPRLISPGEASVFLMPLYLLTLSGGGSVSDCFLSPVLQEEEVEAAFLEFTFLPALYSQRL